MPHIILLGDSIFDNSTYVHPAPDVVAQLQKMLPAGWKASLRAVDGSVAGNVAGQLARLPSDATHLVLSVGGNDLLNRSEEMLHTPVTMSSEVFLLLAGVIDAFDSSYRRAVEACLVRDLPLTVCTIYTGNFADPEFQTMARVAVTAFNDVILRVALEKGLRAIDLRMVCAAPEDYANPIEPSAVGGEKIARAVWRVISSA